MSNNRRDFIKLTVAGVFLPFTIKQALAKAIPIRAITRGLKYHWFGYYDKFQFDLTNRYVLGMEVDFEGRTPQPDDEIKIGMVDIQDNDRWIELDKSMAWGWQQGCMLQWIPGSQSKIIWNDRIKDRFVSHVLDVKTGEKQTLPKPVYALSQDGQWAIGANFNRIQNMRPGYGYKGSRDAFADRRAPKQSGIYRIDLKTGESRLVVTLDQVANIPHQGKSIENKWHYFNHLLVSPDSQRFIFLHRWRETPDGHSSGGFTTRMFTANKEGTDLYILDPSGFTSHFIWRDPRHVCAWTRPEGHTGGFYLFEDQTRNIIQVGKGVMTKNGHNTYLPRTDNQWILNDTYPQGRAREQIPYVYHKPTNRKIELGRFHLPPEYKGEWRCDLHPRSSRDGKRVVIDSPHGGNGRQMYLIDISSIVL